MKITNNFLRNNTVKDYHKKLDAFYKKDKGKQIRDWLEVLKRDNKDHNIKDNKVPGLLNNNKIQLETIAEVGTYNIILAWIRINFDKFKGFDFEYVPKFKDFDFEDVPKSSVKGETLTDLHKEKNKSKSNEQSPKKTFETPKDVKRWFANPETHPITNERMSPMSPEYADIYEKAYKIMKKEKRTPLEIYNEFPKNHVLFGNLDLLFYTIVSEKMPSGLDIDKQIQQNMCRMLRVGVENTEDKDTILDTEIELLKNRFTGERDENYKVISYYFGLHIKTLIMGVMNTNVKDFKNIDIDSIMSDITTYSGISNTYSLINFLESNKMNNGEIIIDFLNTYNNLDEDEWSERIVDLYNKYKSTYDDIRAIFDHTSGIIDNIEDKKFNKIEDPIDKYFKKYEDSLKEIKDPRFNKLIDLTTFKPIDTKFFFNDEQYAKFIEEKTRIEKEYLKLKKEYDLAYAEYERRKLAKSSKSPKSPEQPKRPQIKLENGTTYILGIKDPLHIPTKIIDEFNEKYKELKLLIDKYNEIKNMSYFNLIRHHTKSSPSQNIKSLSKHNKLINMTRKQINEDILYDSDYPDLIDKCSEEQDVLTQDEFNDENYPLAKLQLMVRLKVHNGTTYRTECVYAPALYNLFVDSVNNKTAFINPITRTKYTDENIQDLMNVMRIIDPDIETPVFLKPINDTKLKINFDQVSSNGLNGYQIYVYREFRETNHIIYNICTIPADIEPTGSYATGSNDLASTVMLHRIFKLFNDGSLLCKYVPPYYEETGNYKQYIKLMIHFNRYKTIDDWIFDSTDHYKRRTKQEIIDMFKLYAQEINNFIY